MKQPVDIHRNLQLTDLPGEEWMDVYGYDGIYHVSNLGRVKALPREVRCGNNYRLTRLRIMRQGWNARHGLWIVVLCVNMERRTIKVSRMVWEAFNGGPPSDGKVVMHRNKFKTDDRLFNLEAVTVLESNTQNYRMGVSVYQENLAALHVAQVAELDALLIASHSARICRTCKRELPNAEFYRSDATFLHRRCKDCRLTQRGVRDVGKQRLANELFARGLRRCNPCGTVKPLTDFGSSRSSPGGYNHKCRACVRSSVSDQKGREAGSPTKEGTDSPDERGAQSSEQTPQP